MTALNIVVTCPQAVGSAWEQAVGDLVSGRKTPFSWQQAGATFASQRPATLLAMEPRTGKTFTSLLAAGLGVGVTATVVLVTDGATKARAAKVKAAMTRRGADEAVVVVVNDDAVWRGDLAAEISGIHWDAIIVDESHRIKSPGGKRSRWLANLAAKQSWAKRLCLTGTPLSQSPLDAYGQVRFLDRSVWPSYIVFRNRFMISDPMFPGAPAQKPHLQRLGLKTPWRNMEQFAETIDRFAFRVRLADVIEQLPETHDRIVVQLSPDTMRFYRKLEADMIASADAGEVTASNALVKSMRLRQATGDRTRLDGAAATTPISGAREKARALHDWLEGIPADEPVVVFGEFTDDLDAVAAVADEMGRPYSEVSGRGKTLSEWQAGETTILGVQTRSGGLGIDLSRSRLAVFYSVGWSLGDHYQALSRIKGVGQKRAPGYYYLVAAGTIDETIATALVERRDVVESVMARLTKREVFA